MEKPTFKKSLITGFASVTESDVLKGSDLVLLTTFGVVKGHMFNSDDQTSEENVNIFSRLQDKAYEIYKEDYLSDEEGLPGNDGCLHLTNVEIISGSGSHFIFNDLIVFFDQIIGITMSKNISIEKA